MPKYFPGKLKPEFKQKWLVALRSGEYAQGAGTLYQPKSHVLNTSGVDHYCCLGVACKANGQTYYKPDKVINTSMGLPDVEDAKTWWEREPSVRTHIDSPRVMYKKKWQSLTGLNDDVRLTFNEIADLIEAQL